MFGVFFVFKGIEFQFVLFCVMQGFVFFWGIEKWFGLVIGRVISLVQFVCGFFGFNIKSFVFLEFFQIWVSWNSCLFQLQMVKIIVERLLELVGFLIIWYCGFKLCFKEFQKVRGFFQGLQVVLLGVGGMVYFWVLYFCFKQSDMFCWVIF